MGRGRRFREPCGGDDRVANCRKLSPTRPKGCQLHFNVGMRAVVTCEGCGFRQEVARDIPQPTSFHIICHRCEQSLMVSVSQADIRTAEAMLRPRPAIR